MARLTTGSRKVFIAPTKGRAYLTKAAAASAEARAMLTRKYPTESRELDVYGREVDSGWHWSEDERHQRAYARLARLLRRTL